MWVFLGIVVFAFVTIPSLGESLDESTVDPLDLDNPIDVSDQQPSPTSEGGKRPPMEVEKASPIVLFDDERDELRHYEMTKKINSDKESTHRWFGGDSSDKRQQRNIAGINIQERENRITEIGRQRERDRMNHSSFINTNRDIDRFSSGPSNVNRNRITVPRLFETSNRRDQEIDSRILRERNEEIQREVRKALENKKRILRNLAQQKTRGRGPFPRRSGYEEGTLVRRDKVGQRAGFAPAVDIERRREADRRGWFMRRRGNFDSPLERRKYERREKLLKEDGRAKRLERQVSRDTDIHISNERLFRPRDREIIEDLERRREEMILDLERRREEELLNLERQREEQVFESLERRREEEKFRDIERRRKEEILSEERRWRIDVNRGPANQKHHGDKPPILIYEQVAVPVPVEIIGDFDDYQDDYRLGGPFISPQGPPNPPPLQISDLYDERAPDRSDPYLDRRPGRPDIGPQGLLEDVIHVEEGILVQNVPSVFPVHVPLAIGAPAGHIQPILGPAPAQVVSVVDPSIGANIALTSEAVAASQIGRLKQAAAIANINRLSQLQVANAAIKNQAVAQAVTSQAALAEAANLNRLNQLHQAAAISNIGKIKQASNVAQAVSNQAALTEAAQQQALLSHSLINKQLVATALTEDQVSKSQKLDFMKLVLKHGLRKALREQLRQHLKSKAHQEVFIHRLQATKEDLIRRLILLKPYFTSPGHGGFILPAFIPNIPVGAHISQAQITELPKIQLLPSTTLLSSDFRLPPEITTSLQKDIDIRFVEHILRLPEVIFQKVFHIPKKDFILTLFPRLYRETVSHLQFNPEKHYYPNIPHEEVVKEHHHHHIHIHKPTGDHGDTTKYPPYPSTAHGHDHHQASTVTIHNHPHPHLITQGHDHDEKQEGQIQIHFPGEEIHTVHHPEQQEIILPTSNYKLKNIPHRVQLPLEKSSYVSYDPPPFDFHDPLGNYQGSHGSDQIKFLPSPSQLTPVPLRLPPHELVGINVRPKGVQGHGFVPIASAPIPSDQLFLHSHHLQGRHTSSNEADSNKYLSFNLRGNGQVPPPKHAFTKILPQAITPNHLEIPSPSPPFLTTTPRDDIFHPSFVHPEIRLTTLKPVSIGSFGKLRPSTLRPKPVIPIFPPLRPTFSAPTTPRSIITTFSTTPRPITTTFPTTPRPVITSISTTNTPFLPTSTTLGGLGDDINDINFFTSTEPFTADDSSFSLTPFSTVPPPISTITPFLTTFRGFSGNVRQKTVSERLAEEDESGNDLERAPGTDSSDDEHLFSIFQKKKGNATNSVVDQIRQITNIFGGRLQANVPDAQGARSSFTALPFSNFLNSYVHDSVTSTNDISTPGSIFTNPPPAQTISGTSIQTGEKISTLQSSFPGTQIPNVAIKKTPMPRRVNLSGASFSNRGFPSNQPVFPFQGGTPTVARSIGQVRGQGHNTFTGIPIKGLEALPSFLRESPQCSTEGPTKRSFCLYPEGYQSDAATSVIKNYENDIRRMMQILSKIPRPKLDLNVAAKQISELDFSVSCETEDREVKLSWSRDILGSWFSILQSDPFEQKVTVTTCGAAARAKGCRPLLQPRPFVAFHPSDVTRKPYVMEFPLPVGCVYAKPSHELQLPFQPPSLPLHQTGNL